MISAAALEDSVRAAADSISARLGVCARSLDGSKEIRIAADETYPAASSIKMYVLYAVLAGAEQGLLSLDDRIELVDGARKPGSGVLFHLSPGIRPTIRDLATLMMMISDNTALLMLVKHLGLEVINDRIESLGLVHTRFGDWSRFETEYADSMKFGYGRPAEFVDFLLAMRRGDLLDDASRTLFWDILRIQKYIEPLRRLLPASPWAREFGMPETVWVASKSGVLDDCCCESGFVSVHHGGWALSVMLSDLRTDDLGAAEQVISNISYRIYQAWSPLFEGESK